MVVESNIHISDNFSLSKYNSKEYFSWQIVQLLELLLLGWSNFSGSILKPSEISFSPKMDDLYFLDDLLVFG